MNICTICWDKMCNHSERYKVEIDDNIAEIICILNKKGYETLFCCGGHITNNKIKQGYIPNIYISFNKYNSLIKNINTECLGDNWSWYSSNATLRYLMKEAKFFRNHDVNDGDITKMNNTLDIEINKLKDFVDKLPNR